MKKTYALYHPLLDVMIEKPLSDAELDDKTLLAGIDVYPAGTSIDDARADGQSDTGDMPTVPPSDDDAILADLGMDFGDDDDDDDIMAPHKKMKLK
jgi:hypothetical protein